MTEPRPPKHIGRISRTRAFRVVLVGVIVALLGISGWQFSSHHVAIGFYNLALAVIGSATLAWTILRARADR